MEAHTTADDPTRYRSEEELAEWKARDPIARFETYLEDRGLLDDDGRAALDAEAEAMATRLREAIYDAPHGDPTELFDHVYVDPPASYAEQRDRLQAELDQGQG